MQFCFSCLANNADMLTHSTFFISLLPVWIALLIDCVDCLSLERKHIKIKIKLQSLLLFCIHISSEDCMQLGEWLERKLLAPR